MHDPNATRTILVVEDSDDDFEATERALSTGIGRLNPVVRCKDGLDAWDYLNQTGPYVSPNLPRRPGIVLLDLNMPGLDGRKLLARMKNDPKLCKIPVVIMTTSAEDHDVEACYRAGANTYVCKPVSWAEFAESVSRLHAYWFDIAILPK